jgi:hypothetical protein
MYGQTLGDRAGSEGVAHGWLTLWHGPTGVECNETTSAPPHFPVNAGLRFSMKARRPSV